MFFSIILKLKNMIIGDIMMKKKNNSKLVARAFIVGMSIVINGATFASDSVLTRSAGAPVGNNQNSLTAGPAGPTLLQDHYCPVKKKEES